MNEPRTEPRIRRSAALAIAAGALGLPYVARAQAAAVRFGASPAATQAEAYYALQLGVFKQLGIDASTRIVTRSSDSLAAVVRGDLDIGSTTPQAIANAIVHGLPIRVVASGAVYAGNPPPVQLCVAKSSPIADVRGLETATIAVQTLNDSQSLAIMVALQQNRLDPKRPRFIEMPFSTMAAALERGEAQAACIVEPFASASRETIRTIPRVYDVLGTRWALGAWFARRDWIAQNQSLLNQVVGGLYATARRINTDPASIDGLLAEYSKVPVERVKSTPKPIWAERFERSNFEPQMQYAAEFRLVSRYVGVAEMTSA